MSHARDIVWPVKVIATIRSTATETLEAEAVDYATARVEIEAQVPEGY